MSKGIIKALDFTIRKAQAAAKKRRKGIIFSRMSVAHVDDEADTPGEFYQAEKVLYNGDIYTGKWAENCPNGTGKYLWTDGCMYVGEWLNGKPTGVGRFSWPSGATYEGQFKNGYMDGEGTYTGQSNDTYRGCWVYNMRHGKGSRFFPCGDRYVGEWRRGQPNGQGRYQWGNGDHYIGQWRNGKMYGNGTLLWVNGNRYDGYWEDGEAKGNGTFRWEDGSFYVGNWSRDPKEQSGTYYPSSPESNIFDWDPHDLYEVHLAKCRVDPGEKITVFPSQKLISWPCEGKFLHKQVIVTKTPRAVKIGSKPPDASSTGSRPLIRIQPPKRQGETISKGHRNYELMLNLQLGVRHSVGRPAPAKTLDLKATAFDTKEKVWTRFPPEGSKLTPPHPSCDFKWKDYCPLVFRTLRKCFKVDPADYMLSICGNDALRELSSPGKSGSFFYLTNDDKYMIKTMKKSEVKVLLKMLPAYYNHVRAFENTLVTKFFGLHCVKMSTGPTQKKVRFVIMGNLFCTEYVIHRRYDLKGSSLGRLTDVPETEIDSTTTLKDLDLNFIFRLQKLWFQEFCRQVDHDSDFLEQERIMDYSLLVGIHFREVSQSGEPLTSDAAAAASGDLEGESTTPRISRADMDLLDNPSRCTSTRLGINMAAKAELTVRRSNCDVHLAEPTGQYYDVILFFGIIDILQDYDISKKLEHAYKAFQYDATSISAVDPRQYSQRFRNFIFKVFAEDI